MFAKADLGGEPAAPRRCNWSPHPLAPSPWQSPLGQHQQLRLLRRSKQSLKAVEFPMIQRRSSLSHIEAGSHTGEIRKLF